MCPISWQPSATFKILAERARIIASIREFFSTRGVLEVETPVLSHATVTDPHIESIPAVFKLLGSSHQEICFLQTSPEYAMKRLLAEGSGSIFQITKAFRQGEMGLLHNPEFTMLEWYRVGFDHHALMDEMDLLLQTILKTPPAKRYTYHAIFEEQVNVNPHAATVETLKEKIKQYAIHYENEKCEEKSTWLDILFSHVIEPKLKGATPFFIYDYPITHAALAKVRDENPPVASRFEVYVNGVELANGFHELQDAKEQHDRFEKDLFYRKENNLSKVPFDERFLSALSSGLPDCSGVALGVDRLIMLALGESVLSSVLSFSFDRA